jgi:GTP-binding protein
MVKRAEVVEQIRDRLPFLDWAPVCFTSATRKEGLPELFHTIDEVAAEFQRRIPAAQVSETLRAAIERRPVSVGGVPLMLQSASQVSVAPPTFALRVNRPTGVHFSYERYLVKSLRHAFGLSGTPIRLSLRKGTTGQARAGSRKGRR